MKLRGTVTFRASLKGNGLKFPSCEYDPREPGVPKVEIEGPDGREIQSTIHLASVETEEAGKDIATKVLAVALDWLSFFHNVAIENANIIGGQFEPLDPPPGVCITPAPARLVITTYPPFVVIGTTAAIIKGQLEQDSSARGNAFGLFRSARLSESPVEEFIHLYNLLLMFLGDSQKAVDHFIEHEEPATPLEPSGNPKAKAGETETVYTRLRNELGHPRKDTNLNATKAEMARRAGNLAALTKKAIELYHKKEAQP